MDLSLEEQFRIKVGNLNPNLEQISNFIDEAVKTFRVVIFSKTTCPFCVRAKKKFDEIGVGYYVLELNHLEPGLEPVFKEALGEKTGMKTVPNIFVSGVHVGGCDKTMYSFKIGRMYDLLDGITEPFDFDLIVIGAGSGGIAAAKEAVNLGKTVALFDYVQPSTHGNRWGVGGTCVNVGCIPKKLFHQASLIGDLLDDGASYGWQVKFSARAELLEWTPLVNNVQNYIRSINLNYMKTFVKSRITYHNKYASFIDKHTVEAYDDKQQKWKFTAQNFLIATGTRPFVPDIPGIEFAITSDDIFFLKERPQKVLIVGASYIALECAGFLNGLGSNVTVAVRSQLLRGFDRDLAERVGEHMKHQGVRFFYGYVPESIHLQENMSPEFKYKVTLKKLPSPDYDKEKDQPPIRVEEFSVVLFATGRRSRAKDLKVEQIGVKLNHETFKIETDDHDKSTCRTIYSVGDVAQGRPELTPVAIKAGRLLVQRLFTDSTDLMDYNNVPTTIFTPVEYSCVGYSEEDAKKKFGMENIVCFDSNFVPLEWKILHPAKEFPAYAKMICRKDASMNIVGLHYLGPDAGEVMQGFALAVKLGCTKKDMDHLVGIHPTCAEIFTMLTMKRDPSSGDGKAVKTDDC